ncbi:hypothetical protein QFZ27_006831 [Inquilinus ginsengisoli]|uniref:hypothetical protein n=1 Tax=Inquilinus ginsengisoli TaxID=363840 RepID=UPI003D2220E1
MVFGGAKISAPAMAAAHGMKEVTLHQATNKQVRPLVAQAAGGPPAADPAAIPAGSMELAGHMLPTSPDLVPFPEVPRARPAKFTGLPRAPAMPQMPTESARPGPQTARPNPAIPSGGTPADPAAAVADLSAPPRKASAAAGRRPPAAAPPHDPLDEATIRPGGSRPNGRKRSA